MLPRLTLGVALLALALAGCSTPSKGAGAASAPSRPAVSARAMMDACWPTPGAPAQRVTLTFIKDGGRLKDVVFESEGAPNTVGRCLQQVAWSYPWEGAVPDTLALTSPATRPSGWVYLAHVTLLDETSLSSAQGLSRPAPLVRACLEQGTSFRKGLRFRVQPQPASVSLLSDTGAPDRAVTDAERCVEAVLAATAWPGTRTLEFSFPDFNGAPAAAAAREVAHYFGPPGPPSPEGTVDPLTAKERISERQPAVSACWEAALARRAGLSGARTLRIRLTPDGAVAFTQVIANRSDRDEEAVDYLLDTCLVGAVSPLRLPPPGGGGGEFAYSWVFAHR